MKNSKKFYDLEENKHPYVTKNEGDARVVREGNKVHVYMAAIRSHLAPDNIEGIHVGDEVYFHFTNREQDWDIPHGFAIKGANTAELLVMPGETQTLKRSEEHTSELQSLMRISYAVFCLKTTITTTLNKITPPTN